MSARKPPFEIYFPVIFSFFSSAQKSFSNKSARLRAFLTELLIFDRPSRTRATPPRPSHLRLGISHLLDHRGAVRRPISVGAAPFVSTAQAPTARSGAHCMPKPTVPPCAQSPSHHAFAPGPSRDAPNR